MPQLSSGDITIMQQRNNISEEDYKDVLIESIYPMILRTYHHRESKNTGDLC